MRDEVPPAAVVVYVFYDLDEVPSHHLPESYR
jgi:hypothetical protein